MPPHPVWTRTLARSVRGALLDTNERGRGTSWVKGVEPPWRAGSEDFRFSSPMVRRGPHSLWSDLSAELVTVYVSAPRVGAPSQVAHVSYSPRWSCPTL